MPKVFVIFVINEKDIQCPSKYYNSCNGKSCDFKVGADICSPVALYDWNMDSVTLM